MTNRWPFRPETLVKRFEEAVRLHEQLKAHMLSDEWPTAAADVERTRRDLLARIAPATARQAKAKS